MNGSTLSTSDPAIDSLLVSVREAIVTVTGSSLVGLYLFGSLATGDFDSDVSDIDLIAVLADPPRGSPVPIPRLFVGSRCQRSTLRSASLS